MVCGDHDIVLLYESQGLLTLAMKNGYIESAVMNMAKRFVSVTAVEKIRFRGLEGKGKVRGER